MVPTIEELQDQDIPEELEDPHIEEVPLENVLDNIQELDILEEDEL